MRKVAGGLGYFAYSAKVRMRICMGRLLLARYPQCGHCVIRKTYHLRRCSQLVMSWEVLLMWPRHCSGARRSPARAHRPSQSAVAAALEKNRTICRINMTGNSVRCPLPAHAPVLPRNVC